MKQTIINFFTKNLGLKFMSVAFAIMLWFMVVRVDDPIITKSFSQIPVELTNERIFAAAEKVYEIEDKTDVISVSVTGKRSILDTLSRDNFKATADIGKLTADRVPIEVRATKYADKIDNLQLKGTGYVLLDIENLETVQLPIEVVTNGTLLDDYTVGNTTLAQNIVRVSGPESTVGVISKAVVKVDISNMADDISVVEDIALVDAAGATVDTDRLALSIKAVNVNVELWQLKEVPLGFSYTGECAPGYGVTGVDSISPARISIAGRKETLLQTDSIEIPADEIDITNASKDYTKVVSIEKYLPKGISLIANTDAEKEAAVVIGVSQLQSKHVEMPVQNISVINIPAGMTATVGGLGDLVALEVMGLGAEFDNLDPNAIVGIIDCDKLELPEEIVPGEYTSPVEFLYPEGISGGNNPIAAVLLLQYEE